MEENKKLMRQCPEGATLEGFIIEIANFLGDIGAAEPEDFCALLATEVVEAETFLDTIADCIDELNTEALPLGVRAQIERLTCIIRLFADRVGDISCPDDERLMYLIYEILCVVAEAFAILTGILVKLSLLTGTFLAANPVFFECLVCKLIDEIACLEDAVKELSCLIIALISADIAECTPCYVATNAGKRPRVNVNTKNVCSTKKY